MSYIGENVIAFKVTWSENAMRHFVTFADVKVDA